MINHEGTDWVEATKHYAREKLMTSRLTHFFQKALGRKRNSHRLSNEDENFVGSAASGMLAQIQHETNMRAARGNEPISVRLVPQVPIRDADAAAGWIGGGACRLLCPLAP